MPRVCSPKSQRAFQFLQHLTATWLHTRRCFVALHPLVKGFFEARRTPPELGYPRALALAAHAQQAMNQPGCAADALQYRHYYHVLIACLLLHVDDACLFPQQPHPQRPQARALLHTAGLCAQGQHEVLAMLQLAAPAPMSAPVPAARQPLYRYLPGDCDRVEELREASFRRALQDCTQQGGALNVPGRTPLPTSEQELRDSLLVQRPQGAPVCFLDLVYCHFLRQSTMRSQNLYLQLEAHRRELAIKHQMFALCRAIKERELALMEAQQKHAEAAQQQAAAQQAADLKPDAEGARVRDYLQRQKERSRSRRHPHSNYRIRM